jgi:hypothetical protein
VRKSEERSLADHSVKFDAMIRRSILESTKMVDKDIESSEVCSSEGEEGTFEKAVDPLTTIMITCYVCWGVHRSSVRHSLRNVKCAKLADYVTQVTQVTSPAQCKKLIIELKT